MTSVRKCEFENSRYRGAFVITSKPNTHYVKYRDKYFGSYHVRDQLTYQEASRLVTDLMKEDWLIKQKGEQA